MFRCHVIKELSGYLDNQLSDKQKLKIDKHLQECVLCSNELSRLRVLSEKLKKWHAPVLDADFDNSVRNEIVRRELEKGEVKMKKNTLFILVPSSVLAALLMFAFIGQYYMRRGIRGYLADMEIRRMSSAVDGLDGQFEKSDIKKEVETKSRYRQLAESESIGFSAESYGGGGGGDSAGVRSAYIREPGEDLSLNKSATVADSKEIMSPPAPTVTAPYEPGKPDQVLGSSVIVIQPVLPATGIGEKIIRTGTIKLEVEDGKETYSKISMMCQELNGFLASSNFYKDGEARESGTLTLRIPKEKFSLALDRLSAFGKVENINTASQDVSQEYANLQSQLDGVMIIYNKMLEALKKRQTTISEAVRLESELTPVLNRVQNLKNKIEYLNNAIALTTITVEFHEAKISIKALNESKRYIKESILAAQINAVKTLSKILPLMIGLAVLIIIVAVIAVALKNWIVRTFKRG